MRTKEENPNGLHQRYKVTKADGSPTDPNAVYFVLRLDLGGSDSVHTQRCRLAASEYARHCEGTHLQQVGRELADLVNEIESGMPDVELDPRLW